MREICIINKGENLNKIAFSLGVSLKEKSYNAKTFGYKYVEINPGSEDITIVRNYNPYNIKKIRAEETMFDIYALGYEVVGGETFQEGDLIVLKKPEGVRYSVKPLETLMEIASRFGVTENEIMQKNNLITDKLFVGQILLI